MPLVCIPTIVAVIDAECADQFEPKHKEVHAVRKSLVEQCFIPIVIEKKAQRKKREKLELPVFMKQSPQTTEEVRT